MRLGSSSPEQGLLFTALWYIGLEGPHHASHQDQACMIRRYVIWRNKHGYDERRL
jgi:hypothetical protein